MEGNEPVINGLVLAGGKSVRMGMDKGTIRWHGKEQRYYIADLLETFCSKVFVSCRKEQGYELDSRYKAISDSYIGIGPMGAILSAFKVNADCAWLSIACDLPLIDTKTLSFLIEHRDPRAVATTFKNPYDSLPEPIATIWEPKSYDVLLNSFSRGYSSLRMTLMNNNVKIISPENPDALINVNTVKEFEKVKQILAKE